MSAQNLINYKIKLTAKYSKTCLKQPLKKRQNKCLKTGGSSLVQVESIAECSTYFWIASSLFDLIFYVPVNKFSVMLVQVFLGWTSTKQGLLCLAQGHNALTPVRLQPATPRSRYKHSTTKLSLPTIKCHENISSNVVDTILWNIEGRMHSQPSQKQFIFRVPTEIQKQNSMIFPWFFHDQ